MAIRLPEALPVRDAWTCVRANPLPAHPLPFPFLAAPERNTQHPLPFWVVAKGK